MKPIRKAPFPLGIKVRYPGPEFKEDGKEWVRIGDIGEVINIAPGVLDPGDEYGPIHESSIISFNGTLRAVDVSNVRRSDGSRYEVVR